MKDLFMRKGGDVQKDKGRREGERGEDKKHWREKGKSEREGEVRENGE